KAPRRSDGWSPWGTCTTPDRLSPADGKVTGWSVMGIASVFVRLFAFRVAEPELAPAGIGLGDVVRLRPNRRGESGAAVVRIGIVIEVLGSVDQHAVPLAGAEQRRIAVALTHGRINPHAGRGRHDDHV